MRREQQIPTWQWAQKYRYDISGGARCVDAEVHFDHALTRAAEAVRHRVPHAAAQQWARKQGQRSHSVTVLPATGR